MHDMVDLQAFKDTPGLHAAPASCSGNVMPPCTLPISVPAARALSARSEQKCGGRHGTKSSMMPSSRVKQSSKRVKFGQGLSYRALVYPGTTEFLDKELRSNVVIPLSDTIDPKRLR